MIIHSGAKINLGLYVFDGRADGYHDIESIFLAINEKNSNIRCDVLEITQRADNKDTIGKVRMLQSGLKYPGEPSENICVKAYNLLDNDFNLPPVTISLEKHIPVGAGLGGGSADGVATLKAINQIFSMGLSTADLVKYATRLGSDCPFFVYATQKPDNKCFAMVGKGRGEILEPVEIPALQSSRIELFFPEIAVSTAYAYSKVKSRNPAKKYTPLAEIVAKPVGSWQGVLVNDFEEPVFAEHPSLAALKQELLQKGATYASMTGSGAAVYSICQI